MKNSIHRDIVERMTSSDSDVAHEVVEELCNRLGSSMSYKEMTRSEITDLSKLLITLQLKLISEDKEV